MTPIKIFVGCRRAFAVLAFSAFISTFSLLHAATDSGLVLGITLTNQNVVLSWFGSNSVAYQVESGPSPTSWTNLSSALNGGGAWLYFTNSIAGNNRFFRIKKLPHPETISASFDPLSGVLTVTGDDLDNSIAVSRNVSGTLLVNNGIIPITGGEATVGNTVLIQIFGLSGNDQLSLHEANGPLPASEMFGHTGDDTLTGGSGADWLSGGPDSDTLIGRSGADTLLGGGGNDTLTGNAGNDLIYGEAGNDTMIWNPGDDTDLNEGGGDADTIQVNGEGGPEVFTTTANGTRVRFDRLNPAPFSLDIGTSENLVLNANGGDDSFSATGNLAALIQITVDGGPGLDTILGSNGADLLFGGDGDDFIDGQQANDVIFLGADNDTFQWDPGDGSDTVEGQAGTDKLLFNGSGGSEIFDVMANGSRVRFTRHLGSIVMDLDDVETLQVNALTSNDTLTVNDLSGTDLTSVNVDLASTIGGSTGDGAIDTIIVNGTAAPNYINLTVNSGAVEVSGLAALVRITHPEMVNDDLIVNGLGGTDTITTDAGVTNLIGVTINQ